MRYLLVDSVANQFDPFYQGFHKVSGTGLTRFIQVSKKLAKIADIQQVFSWFEL